MRILSLLFLGLASGAAHAVPAVITFTGAPSGATNTPIGSPYIESGFQLTSRGGLQSIGTADLAYTGSTAGAIIQDGGTAQLTKVGGGTFSIQSFDLAQASNLDGPVPQAVKFTGNLFGGGTVSQTFGWSGPSTHFVFQSAFTNLVSLDFGPHNFPYYQFDNISLDGPAVPEIDPSPAAVPLALLFTTLLLAGDVRRSGRQGSPGPRN